MIELLFWVALIIANITFIILDLIDVIGVTKEKPNNFKGSYIFSILVLCVCHLGIVYLGSVRICSLIF
jgi:hypothetical protein